MPKKSEQMDLDFGTEEPDAKSNKADPGPGIVKQPQPNVEELFPQDDPGVEQGHAPRRKKF